MNLKFKLISYFASSKCSGFLFLLEAQKRGLFSLFHFRKNGTVFVINRSAHVHNKSKEHYRSNDLYKSSAFINDYIVFKSIVKILVTSGVSFFWKVKVKITLILIISPHRLLVKTLLFQGKKKSSILFEGNSCRLIG